LPLSFSAIDIPAVTDTVYADDLQYVGDFVYDAVIGDSNAPIALGIRELAAARRAGIVGQ
jgi:hypothetical protein